MISYFNDDFSDTPRLKLLKNAIALGYSRKTKFLYKLAKLGWIYDINEDNCIEAIRVLDQYITILKARYNDNWDIHFNQVDSRLVSICVILYYPDITITNYRNESHNIKDLIVSIQLKIVGNKIYPSTIKGIRYKLSFEEYASQYRHSHLHSFNQNIRDSGFYYDTFCLGSETEIRDTMDYMKHHADVNLFEMLLLNIDTVVAWESVEGTPYKYINRITVGDSVLSSSWDENKANIVANIFRENVMLGRYQVDYSYSDGKIIINPNSNYKNYLKQCILSIESQEFYPVFLRTKDEDGCDIPIRIDRSSTPIPQSHLVISTPRGDEVPYFMIHGRKLKRVITRRNMSNTALQQSLENSYPSQRILDYVNSKFTSWVSGKVIEARTFEAHYQSNNRPINY